MFVILLCVYYHLRILELNYECILKQHFKTLSNPDSVRYLGFDSVMVVLPYLGGSTLDTFVSVDESSAISNYVYWIFFFCWCCNFLVQTFLKVSSAPHVKWRVNDVANWTLWYGQSSGLKWSLMSSTKWSPFGS